MTKADLINSIAAKADCTKKDADTALNAVLGAKRRQGTDRWFWYI